MRVEGPHEELTYRIIGVAMAVHRRLGPGHAERVYQRAMEEELSREGLGFDAEPMLPVYDGDLLLGYYVPDLIVEDKAIVELKAFATLHQKYLGQVITYLNHTGLPVGLSFNFGERSLHPRRVLPSPQAASSEPYDQWMFVPDWLQAEKGARTVEHTALSGRSAGARSREPASLRRRGSRLWRGIGRDL